MKIFFASLLLASASAFVPSQQRAFVARPLGMSEEPSTPAAAPKKSEPAGALVPIKEETVEFTAGILGGAAGLLVGGPVLGAIAAAAANYISKMEGDVPDVVQALSKTSIQVFNYLYSMDKKYEVLGKAKASLEDSLNKLKSADSVDPEAVEKVEKALKSTTDKIAEINDEYDLVGAGMTALGVAGDLVEKAIKKATELNEEYQLSDKAISSLKGAVEKAKDAAKEVA